MPQPNEERVYVLDFKEYGDISLATLQRAKGWAILFGVLLLDTGLIDNPRNAVMGERVFRRLLEDGE